MLGFAFALTAASGPQFEVASIKASDPNPSNPMFIGMSADGTIVTYKNITLRDCIQGAYRAREFQVVGPDWMTNARFEIRAKLPQGASSDQIPEMLQALLAERFKLEIRHDVKDQNVYALLVGDGGAKLKPAEQPVGDNLPKALGPDGKPRSGMMFRYLQGGVAIAAPSASLASLVGLMSRFTARPVVDMTAIAGQYDFSLTFASETINPNESAFPGSESAATSAEPVPSLFDAVKQYGLRLEARKAPVEMFIVTHVEKMPTEN
jgi:uncharacterized protein (TIGR03435 family)